jgi:hypothetical protein
MSYSNNFVVCVLVDGKVLEERADGVVPIPFGSEYTIRLRNKNSRKAVAKVFIDNEDKTNGGSVVVNANDYVDLERSTLDSDNQKFKFVKSDSPQAADAGKSPDKDFNGVIRIEWKLEVEQPKVQKEYVPYPVPWPQPIWPRRPYPWHLPERYGIVKERYGIIDTSSSPMSFCSNRTRSLKSSDLSEGCTVQGSQSTQTFRNVHIKLESTTTVMQLVLRGYNIERPAEVLAEGKYCTECGAKAAKRAKFCANCGKVLPKAKRRV